MKIGLQINRFTWAGEPGSIGPILAKVAQTADSAGFASIWVMDHFFQIGHVGKKDEPMMESYTTLGYLAAHTKKATLGTMVTGVVYRQPAVLVKAVTTLDVLSGGRAYLGIGAAWNEEESRALGLNFPPTKERFEILEDTLKLAKQMFSGNPKPFRGTHLNIPEPINHPLPISKPIPILIGGGGERKTLKLVAQYADACNLFNTPELPNKLEVLKQHCRDVGRDYDEIEKTAMCWVEVGDKGNLNYDKFIEECKRLGQYGITHVITNPQGVENITPLEVFGEKVIPELSKL